MLLRLCQPTKTRKTFSIMAINIRNITGESAQKAFIDRVISRSDQIYPSTDHNIIRSVTGQLLDLTFGDLDLLADMLRVDVSWLLSGHSSDNNTSTKKEGAHS